MSDLNVAKLPHHEQQELCETRAAYRQGRKLTAVKVYTINNESRHLIVDGVPKLELRDQVKKLFSQFGDVTLIHALKNYPCQSFEEAFHIQYARIQSARIGKRMNDGKNFYGGSLHVFYAPELESLKEVREKIAQRRKDVFTRIERHKKDPIDPRLDPFIPVPIEKQDRKKKYPALPLTQDRSDYEPPDNDSFTPTIGPLPPNYNNPGPSNLLLQAPYQSTELILQTAGVREIKTIPSQLGKRKNYKGQTIDGVAKAKIHKPHIIDTSILFTKKDVDKEEDKSHFVNVKKVDRGITIKIPKSGDKVNKIIIREPGLTQLVKPSDELQTSIQTAREQIRKAMLNQIS